MRVLVIDDEPKIGLTLRLLLEEHEVTVATSGSEAREDCRIVQCFESFSQGNKFVFE